MYYLSQADVVWIIAVVILPLLGLVILYNGHVSRRNAVDYAFSSIDVQLKKRWDLIPRLVESVKGYARHEKEVLERVVEARKSAKGASMEERFRYESEVSSELPRILALAESYPELKADKQFMNLQRNLTEVESQIAAARRAYNAAITDYNDGVQMFPSSIVAAMFGFKKREWFQIDSEESGVRDVRL
ncbi:LemA family protein [Rubritalea tangerina]|uniref:LemA family protein n=1 Tax=Rubritalea tangerina TaxID=430798 RepID=A0ABW4ZAF0_9BACT